jgi:hypothetical protein
MARNLHCYLIARPTMAATRDCNKHLVLLACILALSIHIRMVHGSRRIDLVLAKADLQRKNGTTVLKTTTRSRPDLYDESRKETEKWRVKRGSDPIHNMIQSKT